MALDRDPYEEESSSHHPDPHQESRTLEELAEQVRHLKLALDHRDLMGQAKGLLMERHTIDADRAFGMLVSVSQATHRKVHVVALEFVITRRLEDTGGTGG